MDIEGSEYEIIRDLDKTGTMRNANKYILEVHNILKLSELLKCFENNKYNYSIEASKNDDNIMLYAERQ